jgi:TonB-linked SusC/RagA family outer membrane protein
MKQTNDLLMIEPLQKPGSLLPADLHTSAFSNSNSLNFKSTVMENCLPQKEKFSIYFFHPPLISNKVFFLLFFIIFSFAVAAQQKITGKVTSGDSALTAVTVQLKGTTTATQTNTDGLFSIDAPGNGHLVFTSVGFALQDIPINGRSTINIQMQALNQQLSEVVVVGYGTQKKVTVTGAVATVKGSELEKVPAFNLSNTLVGRLPGITAVNGSGEPGYDGSSIRIRGTNAFGNTAPLIVIDGVPERNGGLERLNPADVETISVLKDASAAIYGQRAANGVILITTRRGKTGKPKLTYDFNQGWSQASVIPDMMNVLEYGEVRNEIAVYEAVPTAQWPAALQALQTTGQYTLTGTTQVVRSPSGFFPTDMAKYADGSDPWGHPDEDWFDAVLKKWSPQQRHNLQLSGGTENVKYLTSIGYQNQDGYYNNSATGYKQYDLRLNLDAKVNKYVTTSIGIVAREEFRFFPTESAGSIFRMLLRGRPNEPAIWPNGLPGRDIENGQNPVVITTNATGYDKDRRDYIQTNGKVEILIPWVQGLKITGAGSVDKYILNGKRWATPWYLYSWDKVSFEADGVTPKLNKELRSTFTDPRLTQTSETRLTTTLTGMVNYDRRFGSHSVNVLAGVQKENLNNQFFNAFRRYYISTAVDQLFAGGDAERTNTGSEYNRARLGYFGRVGYNYKEKYIAEFLWRYDGSYIFPEDHRFGFFPGIMGGWRVSEEDFFANNVRFINNLKLRASWGQVGAEPYIGGGLAEFQYLSAYGFSSYIIDRTIARGLQELVLPNPDFTWEVQTSTNFGIEGSVLKSKLNFEFDYFVNKRDKALFQQSGIIPGSSGLLVPPPQLPPVNYAKLNNKGWEFTVGYTGNRRELRYNISVNGGYAKNKIIQWNENASVLAWQKSVGKPFGSNGASYLEYLYDGVFAIQKDIDANTIDYSGVGGAQLKPGDMKLKDVNGDGKITADDQVRLGRTRDPRFTGGLNMSIQYKNFDLSLLFQGATGGLLFVRTESGDIGNYLKWDYDHRWTIDNPSSVYPRIASRNNTYFTGGGAANNSFSLKKTDYVRFKNFELGYTVPTSILNKAGISNVRVYANGINLVTWDKLGIFDPEAINGSGQYYPQARILNIGASISF